MNKNKGNKRSAEKRKLLYNMNDLFGNLNRVVLVENIPNDFNEDKILSIFRQVGQVTKFSVIDDSENNTYKASCEFFNSSMASNAVKMLNNIIYNGHQLRVALSKVESITNFEASVSDSVISQAVASLPPDQMYELMKQMKLCILNNPNEARNMLLQNPQLAYALLQAQIVMKIVDPKVAIAMLNRSNEQIPNTASNSHSMPFQPFGENFKHISVYPDSMPVSQKSINRVTDSNCSVLNSQVQMFSNVHGKQIPMNKAEFFNSVPTNKNLDLNNPNSLFDSQNETEKAALIMQVLKLSDHQISLLPEDQRQSILILKEQLSRS